MRERRNGSRPRRSSSPRGIVAEHRTPVASAHRVRRSGPTSTGRAHERHLPLGALEEDEVVAAGVAQPDEVAAEVDRRAPRRPPAQVRARRRGHRLDGLHEPLGAHRRLVEDAARRLVEPGRRPAGEPIGEDRGEPVRGAGELLGDRRGVDRAAVPRELGDAAEPRGAELHAEAPRQLGVELVGLVEDDDLVRGQQRAPRREVGAVERGVDDDDVGGLRAALRLLGEARRAERAAVRARALLCGHRHARPGPRVGLEAQVVALAGLRRRRPRRDRAQLGGDPRRRVVVRGRGSPRSDAPRSLRRCWHR